MESCCRKMRRVARRARKRPVVEIALGAHPGLGMMEGPNLRPGRHGFFHTYEALRPRDSLLDVQPARQWLESAPPRHLGAPPIGAWNCLISSSGLAARESPTAFTHQGPGFIDLAGKQERRAVGWRGICRPMPNRPASGFGRRGRSCETNGVQHHLFLNKQKHLQLPSPVERQARQPPKASASSWGQGNDDRAEEPDEPDVVMACAGGHSHQGGCWRPVENPALEIPDPEDPRCA